MSAQPRLPADVSSTGCQPHKRLSSTAIRLDTDQDNTWSTGPFRQVSRLAMPLLNEVIVPMARKDYWNAQPPF